MNNFFDIIIYEILIITAITAVILLFHLTLNKKSWEHKNKKITTTIILLLSLIFLTVFWGSFIEPKILVIKKEKIDIKNIKENIKIVFVTDLHIGGQKNDVYLDFLVKNITKQNPDLILIGGDTIDNNLYNSEEISLLYPLQKLSNNFPVYAIPGNHEYGISYQNNKINQFLKNQNNNLKKYLESINIKYLENDLYKINIKNQNFYLFGADSFWANKTDFFVLEKREKNIPTIALIHNPSIIYEENYPNDFDLALFGHTHGGQIRLPLFGPVGKIDNILENKYYKGFQTDKNNNLIYISSGIGESYLKSRLFNPPEFIVFNIF
jgi:predicted MPP superfamily phosphohydrolase